MSSGYFTTLKSKNEISASLETDVNCILLSNGDEIIRELDLPPDWEKIAIYWEDTMVDSPSTGNLRGLHFVGLCSENRSYSSSADAHCVGMNTSNGSSTSDGNWTGTTSTNTNPSSQVIRWPTTGWVGTLTTGSWGGYQFGGAGSAWNISRYETQYTSSWASSSIAGYGWGPKWLIIDRSYNATYNTSSNNYAVFFANWVNPEIGISKNVFYQGLNSGWYVPKQNQMEVWNQYYSEINAHSIDSVTGASTNSGFWTLKQVDENIYGLLNRLNFFWRANAANPNAKWAIRNIVVQVTSRSPRP